MTKRHAILLFVFLFSSHSKSETCESLFSSLPAESITLELRPNPVILPEDIFSIHEVQVFFEDLLKLWNTPPIWTEEQREFIRNASAGHRELHLVPNFLRPDIEKALMDRIAHFQNLLQVKGHKKNLKVAKIMIHLEGARVFSEYHRHGTGDVTLAMVEEGRMTEFPGVVTTGFNTALFTDGVLHRPTVNNTSENKRMIIFVMFNFEDYYINQNPQVSQPAGS